MNRLESPFKESGTKAFAGVTIIGALGVAGIIGALGYEGYRQIREKDED